MRPVRSTRLVPALFIGLVLPLAAACSSQTSTPEEAARQVVQSVLDEDSEALCDLIATNEELPDEETKKDCVDGLGEQMIELEDSDRKDMENFLEEGSDEVKEDGDRATVKLTEKDSLTFVKIEDVWYWDPIG